MGAVVVLHELWHRLYEVGVDSDIDIGHWPHASAATVAVLWGGCCQASNTPVQLEHAVVVPGRSSLSSFAGLTCFGDGMVGGLHTLGP